MATLLLKVEGLTIMPLPTKEDDGPPPMERRICISFNLQRKVEISPFTLIYHKYTINKKNAQIMYTSK